jgi:hypothetical protein
MSRAIPMGPCLALLRSFDRTNPNPQQTVADGAAGLEVDLGDDVIDTLNDGQFAALIDFYIWKGAEIFDASDIRQWVIDGNFFLPPRELPTYGTRGKAERDVWNRGADV